MRKVRFGTQPLSGDVRPQYVAFAIAAGLVAFALVYVLSLPPNCDVFNHCTVVRGLSK